MSDVFHPYVLKGNDMVELNLPHSGIFYPNELEWMARELRKGDKPGEPEAEREERARDIVNRRDVLRETLAGA